MLTRNKLLDAALAIGYLHALAGEQPDGVGGANLQALADVVRWADSAADVLEEVRRRFESTGQLGHPCLPRIRALIGNKYSSIYDPPADKTDNAGA
jgi:hypothetical protein